MSRHLSCACRYPTLAVGVVLVMALLTSGCMFQTVRDQQAKAAALHDQLTASLGRLTAIGTRTAPHIHSRLCRTTVPQRPRPSAGCVAVRHPRPFRAGSPSLATGRPSRDC